MAAVVTVGNAIEEAVRPDGMNLIASAGETAEQTVFHLHLHVVPRWKKDGFGRIWPRDERYEDASLSNIADRIRLAYEVNKPTGSKVAMDDAAKRSFISEHLYHELRCLLGDATVWRVFMAEEAGFDVVVAMDAALLHARNLFNFLARRSNFDISVTEFGPDQPYFSQAYEMWRSALHQHVLHINDRRNSPNNEIGGQHLNEQVELFAREVLRLWILFESDPDAVQFRKELRDAREAAIRDARLDASGRITSLF